MPLEEIETATLGLNDSERDIEKLWAAEIERRVAEIDSGSCQWVSAEQVHREIRANLDR